MFFYEIRLHSAPKIIFAHHVITDRYRNRFPNYEDLLEISLIEKGTILYDHENGEKSQTPPGTLAPILRDLRCRTYTEPGVLQKHFTVGAVAKYDLIRHRVNEVTDTEALRTAVQKKGTILIPYQWDVSARYDELKTLLCRAIEAHASTGVTHDLQALSDWYALVATLTELVLERLESGTQYPPAAATAYVRAAKRYIAEHFTKRPCVTEIAAHLGISVGYLHAIFKQSTGSSVIEYLNHYAVDRVKDYLKSAPLTLREASERVGIEDPAYMSRLFRKTQGISFRQYCLHHARQYNKE